MMTSIAFIGRSAQRDPSAPIASRNCSQTICAVDPLGLPQGQPSKGLAPQPGGPAPARPDPTEVGRLQNVLDHHPNCQSASASAS